MLIRLDTNSGVPLYQQIVDQVKYMAATGVVCVGDQLPTVRDLAAQLVLNPNTVARAYQELEREDVIETRRGLGSFVSSNGTSLSRAARRKLVADLLDRALVQAHHVDIPGDEVRELLEERLRELIPAAQRTHP
jgi:GntR family transcriptional regulator